MVPGAGEVERVVVDHLLQRLLVLIENGSLFSDPYRANFTCETHFPEPGLSKALLNTRGVIRTEKEGIRKISEAAAIIYEVTVAYQILYHFRVADENVEARMEAMGTLAHYQEILARTQPLLQGLPLRDPGDTGTPSRAQPRGEVRITSSLYITEYELADDLAPCAATERNAVGTGGFSMCMPFRLPLILNDSCRPPARAPLKTP
ncbi:hypothetical protein DFH09DRAFT_1078343 [Mycena vulgaris]|nr:hypothetical protein DFH09DRAFT_1078343 [Mycena vulgaris]